MPALRIKRKSRMYFGLNEFLFALYIYIFGLVKYINVVFPSYSKTILLVIVLGILSFSYYSSVKNSNWRYSPYLLPFLTINLVFLCVDSVARFNSMQGVYIYNFFLYGVVALYLFSRARNLQLIATYSGYFAALFVCLYAVDPFKGFMAFGDYMNFGYGGMLQAFTGLYLYRKYRQSYRLIIFELVALIELFIFANRGAALAAAGLIIFLNLFTGKRSRKKKVAVLMIIIVGFYIYSQLSLIVPAASKYMNQMGLSSYSLNALNYAMVNNTNGSSGRDIIWADAISQFKHNPLLGLGAGSFEATRGYYTHNLILELLVSYGIIGLILFMLCMLYCVHLFTIADADSRPYIASLLIIGIIPLLFSMILYKWTYFWLLLGMFVSPALKLNKHRT